MMFFRRRKIKKETCIIIWFVNDIVPSVCFFYALLMCSSHPFCAARDTITKDSPIIDGFEGLVSAGGRFELGFFAPNRTDRRYVGIWYHNLTPRTVVWVANRESPLLSNSVGVLAIKKGTLQVLDNTTQISFWSAVFDTTPSFHMTVKLMDDGNLVLSDTDKLSILWQSFKSSTNTFIPGMLMDENLVLTSWIHKDDPGIGNFTFKQDLADQYAIFKLKSKIYWKSEEQDVNSLSSDEMPPAIAYLLSNFSKSFQKRSPKLSNFTRGISNKTYNNTRLVIHFNGELQFLRFDEKMQNWNLIWSQPRNRCSVFNACGDFGSCNINRIFACKCLPGFKPQFPGEWDFGDFSNGCTRKSALCGEKKYRFLTLKMMKVGSSYTKFSATSEAECKANCFDDCQCQAYSYTEAENKTSRVTPTSLCRIWNSGDLDNLQDNYASRGQNLSVRIAYSDLESTGRDCMPCGLTVIPYPLSTRLDCGDPMYFRFKCDNSTGKLSFRGLSRTYDVINIIPSTRRFFIQNVEKSCDRGKSQQFDQLLPFSLITWCNTDNVIVMGWEPPPEPDCTTSADCQGWLHTTCNLAIDGKKRCICNTNFQWNASNFNCSTGGEGNLQEILPPLESPRKNHSSRKFSLPLIIVAVLVIPCLLACIISIYIWRRKISKKQDQISRAQLDSERRVKELIDTMEFKEDDEGIDVPFFDLKSILEATDNFSDANKLGQGGYGPVYKGKFPGGQDIAVKRLSRISGQGLQEFKNEVVLIAKLQHRNLVRLRGYCMKGEEKILLYEYMSNKSLDSFIFAQSALLNWEMRFNIILGIARGLLYLHQDSRLRIIHRDLKTSNILLDEEMNPKISDFGLARIVGGKETQAKTATVVGTYGYMSPEYALDGTFSVKSDVFSFGVVLLEIISGKKNTGFYQSKQTFSLLGYAWELWTENKVLDLMDKTLYESCNQNEFIKCVNVGLLCVQEDPIDRPTMSNVITLLDSESAILPIPKQPAFLIRRGNSSTASSSTKPSEITMTLEGR